MPDIFQLTYTSTASHPPGVQDCSEILAKSRRNNSKFDVTGVLVHNTTHFLQTIEGPELIVRILYDRISKDPLHHTLSIVDACMLERRQFGGWAMAYDDGNSGPVLRGKIETLLERCGPPVKAQFWVPSTHAGHTGSIAH
ncbi:hypothetical protein BH11PSE5_BH11PSE5_14590 [soil metagenome]|uniref:BLUF domain-containing protein n=1 Tax=Sphingobium sp. BS19 TaxID=3018973 RepID=UPI0022EDD19B|nr:BLUF domain-containing protein [Sphingobium sp. BS19]GLI97521.1 hypothetical protein Sbs19_13390 [Sphingobium sp. BS19]